jgi:hypothetical protein
MRKQALLFLLLIAPSTSLFSEDLRVCGSLGDKGIETLQWSLGIIDQKLPKVPSAEAKALDELDVRFNSQGLDGVVSPDIKRDLHAAQERGFYYLQIARMRLKEAQVGAEYILVSAESAAGYSAKHEKWPRIHKAQYQDPEAVKLEHATYEFGALERLEIALIEFLLRDEHQKTPLLSAASRNDLWSRSGGYVALLGSYAACKLNGVVTGQKVSGQ